MMMNAVVNAQLENNAVKIVPQCPEDYSPKSSVAKAYRAGKIPPDHECILDGIKAELVKRYGEGATEGAIYLKDVIKATGYYRPSTLQMIRHMSNFGLVSIIPLNADVYVKVFDEPTALANVHEVVGDPHAVDQNEQPGDDVSVPSADQPGDGELQGLISAQTDQPSEGEAQHGDFDDTAKKPAKVSTTEVIQEIKALIGPGGLDIKEEDQERYYETITGKKNINKMSLAHLQAILATVKADIALRVESN